MGESQKITRTGKSHLFFKQSRTRRSHSVVFFAAAYKTVITRRYPRHTSSYLRGAFVNSAESPRLSMLIDCKKLSPCK
jgi:hypothetical protein